MKKKKRSQSRAKPAQSKRGRFKTKFEYNPAAPVFGLSFADSMPPHEGLYDSLSAEDWAALGQYLPNEAEYDFPHSRPLNFAQRADAMLSEHRGDFVALVVHGKLTSKLKKYEEENKDCGYGDYNKTPLPDELLREALKTYPLHPLTEMPVVQRELAKIFADAWSGNRTQSVAAKARLLSLLPRGKGSHAMPAKDKLPPVIGSWRELRRWIWKSNELMTRDFPKEVERIRRLEALYGEHPQSGVIGILLKESEVFFLVRLLETMLKIPSRTGRRAVNQVLKASS